MTTLTEPFVNFKRILTKDIGSTPTNIFDSDHTCTICSILVANQVKKPILFSLYLLVQEGDPTPLPIEYPFVSSLTVESQESFDWLYKKNGLILESGDVLYAYSDYNDNLFSTVVSYHELNELT